MSCLRIALLALCLSTAAFAGLCDYFYISVSTLAAEHFETAAAESRVQFPSQSYPWFHSGRQPSLALTRENLAEIAQVTLCCGLALADMEKILDKSLGTAQSASVSLARYYDEAFQLALKRAHVFDPLCYDCFRTAFTYMDAHFFGQVDEGEVDNPSSQFFNWHYKSIEPDVTLRWGDMITIERDGQLSHIMIHLSDGVVLHKLGVGGSITLEPALQGGAFYKAYFERAYPGRPNQVGYTRWRRQR